MKHLSDSCLFILDQLEATFETVRPEDFTQPSQALSGSTLGQHLRHTLEFFICLKDGVRSGVVNYDKRRHDKQIESDKLLAMEMIHRIRRFVIMTTEDRRLILEVGYDHESDAYCTIETSFFRELAYNLEHAVHHMAIMKIGIRDMAGYVEIPTHFGVAPSTIRYEQTVIR